MSKNPKTPTTDEEMRELLHGLGVPAQGSVAELVKNPWAGGVGFDKPPTPDEMKTLTEAGFEYDEKTQIAWRKDRGDWSIER